MKITLAQPNDKERIARLDNHLPAHRLEACIHAGTVYLLKAENSVIGVLRFSLFWQTIPFLDLLYIDEPHRGKGGGTALMDRWESDMTAQGFHYLLTSTQADETAWRFYEARGYRKTGAFLPPDQQAEEWIYMKDLREQS